MGTVNSDTLVLHASVTALTWCRLAESAGHDDDLQEWRHLLDLAASVALELSELTYSLTHTAPATVWVVADIHDS